MGHFDEVISAIDAMLGTLKDEAAQDIKQRDWCIKEQNKQNNKKEDLEYDISQLEAKIERGELKKAKLEQDKSDTEQAKSDLEDEMQQALDDRTAQNGAFAEAKEDDEKAIALLEDAIAALGEYGSNNPE